MTISNTTLPNAQVPGAVVPSPITGYEFLPVVSGPVSAVAPLHAVADVALADQTVTALGTNRATAYVLIGHITNVTTAASGTGVSLPSAIKPGMRRYVFNGGANPITVYALGSDTIDGTAGSTGVTLTNAKRCIYFCLAAGVWVSAQMGVVSA